MLSKRLKAAVGAPRDLVVANLVTFAAYFAVGAVSVLWLRQVASQAEINGGPGLAIPWLAPGIAVACLWVYGMRAWPAVFAGSFAVWVGIQHVHAIVLLPESAGEALSVVAIVWLLRRWDFRPTLERYRDSLVLIAALAIGRVISSGVDGLTVVALAALPIDPELAGTIAGLGVHRELGRLVIEPRLLEFLSRWWANTAAGGVLVVPLLALKVPRDPAIRRARPAESLTLIALVALWLAAAFGIPAIALQPVLLLAGLLLVLWSAWRFRPGIASVVTLVLAMATAAGYGLQFGMFAGGAFRERLEAEWGFLGLLVTTSLFLTGLVAERRRAIRDLEELATRYQGVLDGNPFPMWAEDPASGEIVLVNPAALRFYGYERAAFLALAPGALYSGDGVAESTEGRRTERHAGAAGAVLEVEVTRVRVAIAGRRLLVAFVEPLAERTALRLAILNADDLERFRLAQAIQTGLLPRLDAIRAGTTLLTEELAHDRDADRGVVQRVRDEVTAIQGVIRRLTRGLSLLADAEDDFATALEQLRTSLPPGSPPLQVAVESRALAGLGGEQRDQIFRLAEEAVRAAALQAGVRAVRVSLVDEDGGIEMRVETDADRPSSLAGDERTLRSLAVRAIAARGRLTVGARDEGGELIRVGVEASSRSGPPTPAGDAAVLTGGFRRGAAAGSTPTLGRRVARGALLAIAYVVVGALSLAYLREVDALGNTARMAHAAPWIPSGVHAVGVMLGGWQLWPAVFLSYTALWWGVSHDTLVSALVGAGGRTIAVLVIAWFVRRLRGQPAFNRLSEVALLAVAAAIGYALVIPIDIYNIDITGSPSESLSAAELSLSPVAAGTLFGIPTAKLYPALRWWLNSVIGVVLTVPVVTAWTREHAQRIRARPLEFLAWCAVLAFALYSILAAAAPSLKLAVLGLGMVCAAWGAVRVGAGLAYFATLAMSLAATASYGLGIGVLATPDDGDGVAALWSFMILLVVTAHLLTTLLVESDAAQQAARELARQYRTLFDAVPHALFAYARDGGEIRLANRAVGERFGYRAEDVLGRSLADFEIASDAAAWLTPSGAWPRRRTRFLTREGVAVDVELTQVPLELDGEPGVLCFAIDVTEQAQLHARMLEATELERRHLMRELHDDLGQLLTGLALGSEALSSAVERGQRPDLESTVFIAGAAEEARRTAMRVLSGISPLQECDGDLLEALRRMPSRLPKSEALRLRLEITAPAAIRLGLVQREHVYKIAQEAVTNAVKHARARQITVSASIEADVIQVCVTDDGIGFDVAQCASGVGLESMRLRASALGGVFAIRSTEGEGTILCCRAPQPRAAA